PTTKDRQGNDVGEQYRSVILYGNEAQKRDAEFTIAKLTAEKVYPGRIVTEIKPLTAFYEAESNHRNYYENNIDQPYCQFVIAPKLAKLRENFFRSVK
ncbi:MAG: peptide-methionine (S)-S-oxide reductase, partial [Patescibacteria group bacterium]|nr:peptide-methionine (S)-S-oxide reductase [Patescibacteria group bacterium]